MKTPKPRAKLNRSITLSPDELAKYEKRLIKAANPLSLKEVTNKTICQDALEALANLPAAAVDLLFADPPYNLSKSFDGYQFSARSDEQYQEFLESWIKLLPRILKPTASLYFCSDWRSSSAMQAVLNKYFTIRNRITWQREKGRGAKNNWKNASEDIWFCTMSNNYTFNLDEVKIKKTVLAPYKDKDGNPKDWTQKEDKRYRLTCPSNLWTDLTVPFWSMSENTDHPTQKPEKMLAKIILASSSKDQLVLDPFCGSGTTSVVAKKLGRNFIGIELNKTYCCLTEKRLHLAKTQTAIQGYQNGVFYERNVRIKKKQQKER